MNNDLIRRSDLLAKKCIIMGRLDQWHDLWANAINRKKTYQRKCTSCGDIAYYLGGALYLQFMSKLWFKNG